MIAILAWFSIITTLNFGGIFWIILRHYFKVDPTMPATMEYINRAEGYDGRRK